MDKEEFMYKNKNFTEIELAILEAIGNGYYYQEIADALNISIYKCKHSMKIIINKLNAKNKTDAAIKALKLGLIKYNNTQSRK